ncbi:hypothetical protein [Spirosoma litoris]
MTDIIVMQKSYIGEEKDLGGGVWEHRSPYMCIGVKNVCIETSSQYKDFLPKVAAQIADTAHEKIDIYFLIYHPKTESYAKSWTPYKLEEEVPNSFLLMQGWDCGKEPEFIRWYVKDLKYLNTQTPSYMQLPLEGVEVEKSR